MATVKGSHGYVVVSWLTDDPEHRDITGNGPHEDEPFESIESAKDHLFDLGYRGDPSRVQVRVAALVEVEGQF
jgi:hypothetical protein